MGQRASAPHGVALDRNGAVGRRRPNPPCDPSLSGRGLRRLCHCSRHLSGCSRSLKIVLGSDGRTESRAQCRDAEHSILASFADGSNRLPNEDLRLTIPLCNLGVADLTARCLNTPLRACRLWLVRRGRSRKGRQAFDRCDGCSTHSIVGAMSEHGYRVDAIAGLTSAGRFENPTVIEIGHRCGIHGLHGRARFQNRQAQTSTQTSTQTDRKTEGGDAPLLRSHFGPP